MSGGLQESMKKVAYRLPPGLGVMTPRYPYKVEPALLAAFLAAVDRTRAAGGAVVEVGVAQGDTSVFVLEHLRSVGDDRRMWLVDTFEGFTPESVEHEVRERGKSPRRLRAFRYGDARVFERKLRRLGYDAFHVVRADAATFDWTRTGPIGAMLLDIDLFLPTKAVLEAAYPLLCPGGAILVDDCVAGGPWDGAWQACTEFCEEHGLEPVRVGRSGLLVPGPGVEERTEARK